MTPLQVALDGRPLQSRPLGGVGRYLMGMLPRLAQDAELHILLDARLPAVAPPDLPHVHHVALPAPARVPGLVWLEVAVAPWLRRFEGIFHATFNLVPLTYTGRTVLTVHDLAPQLHPDDFRSTVRLAWRVYMRTAVRRARELTTVSEFTRQQIADYFGIASDAIVVAPDVVHGRFAPARVNDAPRIISELGVEPPYVVALGGAPRRNLPMAIDAWRLVCQSGADVRLVVLGEPDLAFEPGLHSVGYLDDDAWAAVLAGAQAFCYPTRYEGFGLPALEAVASGTPVVCARVASLPEVLGDAACWSEPTAPAMAEVLRRLLTEPEWHHERRAAGLQRAAGAPTAHTVAEVLLETYNRAAV